MKDRKQHVIISAHKLFIEKGFQATSIQDILEYSGISKGTFYNYFSSKNELLMALFKTLYKKMEQERNELLMGQDPANINIFIKQIELQMETNRANKLISLFEEVYFLNDKELKEFIKQGQLRMVRWIYQRFLELFGEQKQPYLLDCAVMFLGILNNNIKYSIMAYESAINIHGVVKYSVERIETILHDVEKSEDRLLKTEMLEKWFTELQHDNQSFRQELQRTINTLKQSVKNEEDQLKHYELLEFIQSELLRTPKIRKHVIDSAISSLKESTAPFRNTDLKKLEQLIAVYN